jgi:hypothetical protein
MKKQTAVQWLVEQLENHNGVTRAGFEKCIQEAIAMEKEQMKTLYSIFMMDTRTGELYDFEEYYNKTYNNTKASD